MLKELDESQTLSQTEERCESANETFEDGTSNSGYRGSDETPSRSDQKSGLSDPIIENQDLSAKFNKKMTRKVKKRSYFDSSDDDEN